jgi:methyl-accepting chemotaxis protein
MPILFAALVSATVASVAVYLSAADVLKGATDDKYRALMQVRRDALREYLDRVLAETLFWNKNRVMRSALLEFTAAWKELSEPESTLRRLYIDENPYPTGERDNLEFASDGSTYSDVHARYHYWLRSFLLHRGVYDIFLFDPEGNLVYTSFKERDFATNLVTGPWSNTDLGRAFRAARDNPYPSFAAFFDFAPYAPSQGAAASFFASAMLDDSGVFLGVLAIQIPADRINEILQVTAGMGESGETYAVGADLLMRSDSRFSEDSTTLKTRVDTETVQRALAGETGLQVVRDYRGVSVVSAYGPLEFEGVTWAVMAEIDEAEVRQPLARIRNRAAIAVGIGVPLSTLLGLLALAAAGRREDVSG